MKRICLILALSAVCFGGSDMLREETCVRLLYSDDVLGMRDTVLIATCIRQISGGYEVLPKTGGWFPCAVWMPAQGCEGGR